MGSPKPSSMNGGSRRAISVTKCHSRHHLVECGRLFARAAGVARSVRHVVPISFTRDSAKGLGIPKPNNSEIRESKHNKSNAQTGSLPPAPKLLTCSGAVLGLVTMPKVNAQHAFVILQDPEKVTYYSMVCMRVAYDSSGIWLVSLVQGFPTDVCAKIVSELIIVRCPLNRLLGSPDKVVSLQGTADLSSRTFLRGTCRMETLQSRNSLQTIKFPKLYLFRSYRDFMHGRGVCF